MKPGVGASPTFPGGCQHAGSAPGGFFGDAEVDGSGVVELICCQFQGGMLGNRVGGVEILCDWQILVREHVVVGSSVGRLIGVVSQSQVCCKGKEGMRGRVVPLWV